MSSGLDNFHDDQQAGSSVSHPKTEFRVIVQGTTKLGTFKPRPAIGDFIDVKNKAQFGSAMNVAILSIVTMRELPLPKAEQTERNWNRCFSYDALVPAASVKDKPATKCSECEFKDKDLVYRVYCYDLDRDEIFAYKAKGTQLYPFRNFIKEVRDSAASLRDYTLVFKTIDRENDKGAWKSIALENIQSISDDAREVVEAAYEGLFGQQQPADDDVDSDDVPL